MTEKLLGKIDYVDFGKIKDYPFLMGLKLGFKLQDGCSICDGGRYTVNISESCKWESESEKNKAYEECLAFVAKILTDAKVYDVSELLNKPVEVEIEKNTFVNFRILTEVL